MVLLLTVLAPAQQKPDLTQVSIEDLLQMKVTTVGKREQTLSTAAAAVYVISQEDIRRSGATTIPDALRLAPGVQVAQISSKSWVVTIRGSGSVYANKLLVLIDGRSIYSPSYSGVFWDEQDLLLEDIDRIEVIRGPGATLWGTNAVNGVVNIITRAAAETQGTLAGVGTGSYERGFGYVRYGAALGQHGHYRVYGKYARRFDLLSATTGKSALDSWASARLGFRSDWKLASSDSLTLQGDLYRGTADHDLLSGLPSPEYAVLLAGVSPFRGGNLLARWQRVLPGGSQLAAQFYYDDDRQTIPVLYLRNRTFNFDFQHNLHWRRRHDLVWGGGFRTVRQLTDGTPLFRFEPPDRTYRLFSGFAQDEIELLPNRLKLALGSKFESNEFTGVEIQPNVRLLVQPSSRQALWFSVARAARSPSELETAVRGQIPGFGLAPAIEVLGNPHAKAEDLLAYEVGYRIEPRRRLSLDVAAFSNRYQHLSTFEMAAEQPGFPALVRFNVGNGMDARAYGLEITTAFEPVQWWKLTGGYTWLLSTQQQTRRAVVVLSASEPGDNPQHQFQAHSYCSLPRDLELDLNLFFVDKLPAQGIPHYTRVDARLGWKPSQHWELSFAGQNLLDPAHAEFFEVSTQAVPTLVRRSFYGKMTWRF